MKKLASQFISFLSYHNAVPIIISVLFVGGASAFAATATGVIDVPAVFAPKEVDVSTLLSADIDAFDFRPTVTNVVETDTTYTVSYSMQTLAPEKSAWVSYEKTGEFSIAKDALPEDGLQGYVVRKLRDIENGERAYLTRAQEAEKKLAAARAAKPASTFAALVGLALDQIPVPKVEKPIPEPVIEQQSQTPEPVAPTPTVQQDDTAGKSAEQSATTTPETATTATTEGAATSTNAIIPDSASGATTTPRAETVLSTESTSTPPAAATPDAITTSATTTTPVEQNSSSTGQADTASTTAAQ